MTKTYSLRPRHRSSAYVRLRPKWKNSVFSTPWCSGQSQAPKTWVTTSPGTLRLRKKVRMTSTVASVEPVSTITKVSTRCATERRHSSTMCASSFTIMFRHTRGSRRALSTAAAVHCFCCCCICFCRCGGTTIAAEDAEAKAAAAEAADSSGGAVEAAPEEPEAPEAGSGIATATTEAVFFFTWGTSFPCFPRFP